MARFLDPIRGTCWNPRRWVLRGDVARRRIELVAMALAIACAVVFATLWLRARHPQRDGVLIVELYVQKNAEADVNMPYPINIVDRDGKEVGSFDHHGIAHAVLIPLNRYPVVVRAGFEGPMSCRTKIAETGEAVVDVALRRQGCFAREVG